MGTSRSAATSRIFRSVLRGYVLTMSPSGPKLTHRSGQNEESRVSSGVAAPHSGCDFSQNSGAVETIAALATPPGNGAVAVVRISGPLSRSILEHLFHPLSHSFGGFKPRVMHYGQVTVAETGSVIDEVLAVYMPGPATFTGEDVAEIHGHGGSAVSEAVLAAVLAAGARLARPGEFTRRAFLNGRLDLSQAEAVAECIAAGSREALALAQAKLGGLLGQRVRDLRERLRGLCAQLVVAVDFPEEDVEILPRPGLVAEVTAVRQACADLAAGYERARLTREGALVVLAGRVNVGKSSLMNALLGRERAIVTPHPGTTRDFLEESLDLGGLPVRLVDTAGLREAHDPVEAEGLRRAGDLIAEADLVLWVIDVEREASDPALAVEADTLADIAPGKVLGVLNKIDLRPPLRDAFSPLETVAAAPSPVSPSVAPGWLEVSARTGAGLEELAVAIRESLLAEAYAEPAPDAPPAPNLRQRDLLVRAVEELDGLLLDIATGLPYDLLGVRADLARDILAEITGEISNDDVLDLIFSEFCLGK